VAWSAASPAKTTPKPSDGNRALLIIAERVHRLDSLFQWPDPGAHDSIEILARIVRLAAARSGRNTGAISPSTSRHGDAANALCRRVEILTDPGSRVFSGRDCNRLPDGMVSG
jgi:hypothetical protein